MANRYPLIVDTIGGNKIKELPIGDNLNLTGIGVVGLESLSLTGGFNADSATIAENTSVGGNLTVVGTVTVSGDIILDGVNVLNSIEYENVINTPNLNAVALSGSYTDLSDTPDLHPVALSGSYTDLGDVPTFAAVAFTGSYNNLSNRPAIPNDIAQLSDNTGLLDKSFLELVDTPPSYEGQAGKFLKVDALETTLIFSDNAITITEQDVVTALGFTPYDSANPSGFITAEADTLDSVTDRGSVTTNGITVGSLISNGTVSASDLDISGDLIFDSVGFNIIDTNLGGTLSIGGDSSLLLKSQNSIEIYNSVIPSTDSTFDLGSESRYFSSGYLKNTLYFGDLQGVPGKSSVTIGAAGSINITPGSATSRVSIFNGVFRLPTLSTTQRNALTPQFGDIIYNETTKQIQVYVAIAGYNLGEPFPGWVNLYTPPNP